MINPFFWILVISTFKCTIEIPYKECEGLPWLYPNQYYKLKSMLQNCTHINGSLTLYKIQPGDDLSFLKTIEVIDGYLQIKVVGSPFIPLINLKVIRGNKLRPTINGERFSLIIEYNDYEGRGNEYTPPQYNTEEDPYFNNLTSDAQKTRRIGGYIKPLPKNKTIISNEPKFINTTMLKYIQLYSLVEIARGGVYIRYNPGLCYLATSINWDEIVINKVLSPIVINEDQIGKDCEKYRSGNPPLLPSVAFPAPPKLIGQDDDESELIIPLDPPPTCHPKCNGYCWDYDHCQIIYKTMCDPSCPRSGLRPPVCTGPNRVDCCSPTCLGGCTGHLESECLLCRNFYKSVYEDASWNRTIKVCVSSCSVEPPPSWTLKRWYVRHDQSTESPFIANNVPGLSSKYTLGFKCVSRCSPQYFISNGFCLATCDKGEMGVFSHDKRLAGKCEPEPPECSTTNTTSSSPPIFHTPQNFLTDHQGGVVQPGGRTPSTTTTNTTPYCPKRCSMGDNLFYHNKHLLAGCEIVKGHLSILESTFDPRRRALNDTHHYLTRYMHLAELDALRSIRVLSDHLRLQELNPFVTNLDFLDNLEIIGGQVDLIEDKYSIFTLGTNLQYLGLRSLRNVPAGNLRFDGNYKLCYTDTLLPRRYYGDGGTDPEKRLSPSLAVNHLPRDVWSYVTNSNPSKLIEYLIDGSDGGNDTYVVRMEEMLDGREQELHFFKNRSPLDCLAHGLTCNPLCFFSSLHHPSSSSSPVLPFTTKEDPFSIVPQGCWGPGLHQCLKCQGHVLVLELEDLGVHYPQVAQGSNGVLYFNLTTLAAGAGRRTRNLLAHLVNYIDHVRRAKSSGSLGTQQSSIVLDILRNTLDEVSQITTISDVWARFYGKSIDICVPSCGDIWQQDDSRLSPPFPLDQQIEFYKAFLAAIEQIIPLEDVSLSGDRFTFADMKLQILSYLVKDVGSNLGLIPNSSVTANISSSDNEGGNANVIANSLRIFTYEAPRVGWVNYKLTDKSLRPSKSNICLLCHSECLGGCHGPGPDSCYSCKRYELKHTPPALPDFVCVGECPRGFYPDSRGTCQSCHANCYECTGPLDSFGPNGCTICFVLLKTSRSAQQQVCLAPREDCPLGFYSRSLTISQTLSNDEDLFYTPTSPTIRIPMVCLACHENCETCIEPDHYSCIKCKYYLNTSDLNFAGSPACTQTCPFLGGGKRHPYGIPPDWFSPDSASYYKSSALSRLHGYEAIRTFEKHRRCPCHDQCLDQLCHGPTDDDCLKCSELTIKDIFIPNKFRCAQNCPTTRPLIETVDGVRFCTNKSPPSILLSSIPSVIFILLVLGILLWFRKYRGKLLNDYNKNRVKKSLPFENTLMMPKEKNNIDLSSLYVLATKLSTAPTGTPEFEPHPPKGRRRGRLRIGSQSNNNHHNNTNNNRLHFQQMLLRDSDADVFFLLKECHDFPALLGTGPHGGGSKISSRQDINHEEFLGCLPQIRSFSSSLGFAVVPKPYVERMKYLNQNFFADIYKAKFHKSKGYMAYVKSFRHTDPLPDDLAANLQSLNKFLKNGNYLKMCFPDAIDGGGDDDLTPSTATPATACVNNISLKDNNTDNGGNTSRIPLALLYGVLVKSIKNEEKCNKTAQARRRTLALKNDDMYDGSMGDDIKTTSQLLHKEMKFFCKPFSLVVEIPGLPLGSFLRSLKLPADPNVQDGHMDHSNSASSNQSNPRSMINHDKYDLAEPSHRQKLAMSDCLMNRMPSWFIQLAKGMKYLADCGIIHGCFCLDSIYLVNMDTIKIDDYYYNHLSKPRHTTSKFLLTYIEKYFKWLPIECLDELKFTPESDSWAFGVTLWEIFNFGRIPYDGMDLSTYIKEIIGGYRLPQPAFCGISLYTLMIRCWLQYPEIRPAPKEMLDTILECTKNITHNFEYQKVFVVGSFNGTSSSRNKSSIISGSIKREDDVDYQHSSSLNHNNLESQGSVGGREGGKSSNGSRKKLLIFKKQILGNRRSQSASNNKATIVKPVSILDTDPITTSSTSHNYCNADPIMLTELQYSTNNPYYSHINENNEVRFFQGNENDSQRSHSAARLLNRPSGPPQPNVSTENGNSDYIYNYIPYQQSNENGTQIGGGCYSYMNGYPEYYRRILQTSSSFDNSSHVSDVAHLIHNLPSPFSEIIDRDNGNGQGITFGNGYREDSQIIDKNENSNVNIGAALQDRELLEDLPSCSTFTTTTTRNLSNNSSTSQHRPGNRNFHVYIPSNLSESFV